MQLESINNIIEATGNFKDTSFSIGNIGVVMEILRSKLYTNPIRIVIQEIASNARDAHREAGKADLPIIIGLPNPEDMSFYVQDFGPGISPERMENVYLQYGNSTKRADDTQTGGFGLGAKTPFAYNDSFTIESISTDADGVNRKRMYVAFLDQTNVGKVSLVSETETNDSTGVKVQMAVKDNDVRKFEREVQNIFTYWSVKPVIRGADVVIFDDDQYPSYTTKAWTSSIHINGEMNTILIDSIPYPLRISKIQHRSIGTTFRKYIETMFKAGLKLSFNTGEITVAATRENIEDNEKNYIKIIDVIRSWYIRDYKEFLSSMKEAKTYQEACKLVYGQDHIFRMFKLLGESYEFNGHKITNTIHLNGSHAVWKYWKDMYGACKRERTSRINVSENFTIVTEGLNGKNSGRVRTLLKEFDFAYVIRPTDVRVPKINRQWEYDFADGMFEIRISILNKLFGVRCIDDIEPTALPKVKTEGPSYRKKVYTFGQGGFIATDFYEDRIWTNRNIAYFYVRLDSKRKCHCDNDTVRQYMALARRITECNTVVLYGFTPRSEIHPSLTEELFGFCNRWLSDFFASDFSAYYRIYRNHLGVLDTLRIHHSKFKLKSANPDIQFVMKIKSICQKYGELFEQLKTIDQYVLFDIYDMCSKSLDHKPKDLISGFEQQYPELEYYEDNRYNRYNSPSKAEFQKLQEYIYRCEFMKAHEAEFEKFKQENYK